MPPPQDRGHMVLSSTYWWSRIWIFYVELTVSEATQSCPENVEICSKNYDRWLSFWLKPRFWVVSTIPRVTRNILTSSRELTHELNLIGWEQIQMNASSRGLEMEIKSLAITTFPSYTSVLLFSLFFASSNTFLPLCSREGYFFCASAQRSFESRQSQERTKLNYQTHTEQPKWQDYDTEGPLADEENERWK